MRRITGLLLISCATACTLAVAASATGGPYFEGAAGGRTVRPTTLYLTGDSTLEVDLVSWSSWGGATATGNGTAEYHGCMPSCAAGKIHHASVAITLSKLKTCGGRRYYSTVRLKEPDGKLLDANFTRGTSYGPC